MFSGRLVSSCQSSSGVARIMANRSSRQACGALLSKTSDRLEQNTRWRWPCSAWKVLAFRFHLTGPAQLDGEVRRRSPCGPHCVHPLKAFCVSA